MPEFDIIESVEELIDLADHLELDAGDLDEEVHQAASEIASEVNNNGIETQLEFLVSSWGLDEVIEIVRRKQKA